MAALRYTTTFRGAVGANPLTLIQAVAPTNQRLELIAIDWGFLGANPSTAAMELHIIRQTSAGTTGAAITPEKLNTLDTETIQGVFNTTYTVEPTTGAIKYALPLHQLSTRSWVPYGRLLVPGGQRLGFTIVGATSPNIALTLTWEE